MAQYFYQISNHAIEFRGRMYEEIYSEIKSIFDKSAFPNSRFLRLSALKWADGGIGGTRKIREIKKRKTWTMDLEEFYEIQDLDEIYLKDPFGYSITLNEYRLEFSFPLYGYARWFGNIDPLLRNEWRKYMCHVVNLFGGDRVIYLPSDKHFLKDYVYYDGSFKEMENELFHKFGAPQNDFNKVAKDIDNVYFIDDFSDVEWGTDIPLDDYLPEPDDKSFLGFDLNKYRSKDQLKEYDFENYYLAHKKMKDEIHFYHIGAFRGLLYVHQGVVGGKDQLEVKLDDYAPFIFDELKEKKKNEGYKQELKSFLIRVTGHESVRSWEPALREFRKELPWHGLGHSSSLKPYNGSWDRLDEGFGVLEQRFFTVDETLALNLLLEMGKKKKEKGRMDVYRHSGSLPSLFPEDNIKTLIYSQ